jgi:hypothetical protein
LHVVPIHNFPEDIQRFSGDHSAVVSVIQWCVTGVPAECYQPLDAMRIAAILRLEVHPEEQPPKSHDLIFHERVERINEKRSYAPLAPLRA